MVLLTWKAMLRTRNFLGAELLQNLSVIIDEFWAILIWLFICCKTKLKKKIIFFWKNICFLQNIHYLQKKIILHGKKILYWFFFYWKTFFTENEKIHVSFEKYLFIQNLYIPSAKNFFLIIWSLKFQKRTICGIP